MHLYSLCPRFLLLCSINQALFCLFAFHLFCSLSPLSVPLCLTITNWFHRSTICRMTQREREARRVKQDATRKKKRGKDRKLSQRRTSTREWQFEEQDKSDSWKEKRGTAVRKNLCLRDRRGNLTCNQKTVHQTCSNSLCSKTNTRTLICSDANPQIL